MTSFSASQDGSLKDVFRGKYYNGRILDAFVGTMLTQSEGTTMAQNYAKALGIRLRAIRQQQGLSLQGVEEKSDGQWKAVVVGSYERGDRAVTVQRLSELADFYGVPMSELLPGANQFGAAREAPPKLVLDLERLHQLDLAEAAPLSRFTSDDSGAAGGLQRQGLVDPARGPADPGRHLRRAAEPARRAADQLGRAAPEHRRSQFE